jgi:hypothetical protein
MSISAPTRFTATNPCPVCGGHPALPHGQGIRCAGFVTDDGYVHCTREEHAGPLEASGAAVPTFAHIDRDDCRCGLPHSRYGALTGAAPKAARESSQPPRRIVATYEYRNASGHVLYRVARLSPKGFLPQHFNGAGAWESGYADDERVLYRLPEIEAAPGRALFIVEGEKDCDALTALGLLATTNVGGAASWQKHAEEYAQTFRGRSRAVVLPDNDPPGRRWAAQVAASVAAVDCPVYVLELDGLPDGGDVSDWLAAGHTVDELKARVAASPGWTPPTQVDEASTGIGAVRLSDVEAEAVDWLWFGRLGRGKLTLIDGDPGLGKSLLTLDLSARLSMGAAWPDGLPCAASGSVLLMGAEDGLADTVRPRLDAAGADVHRVYALPTVGVAGSEHPPSIPDDIPAIEGELVATGAVLLVIDPLMAFLGGDVNSHRDQDVRRALAPLAAMAERLGVAVLVIRHLNKSSGGPAIYRGGGSIGLAGAARIVLAVGADPEDESRRILAAVKANLTVAPPSLAYRLVEADGAVRIDWLGTSTVTAGQLLAVPANDEERTAVGDAVEFLRERLGDSKVDALAVKTDARKAGISDRTLDRAKARLQVHSERKGFGSDGEWFWSLPDHRAPTKPIDRQPQTVASYEETWRPMDSDGSGERVY